MKTEELFEDVYARFMLHFYREVFKNFSNREATLTTVETFCMEVIYTMEEPTVNEFASFIQISSPNAAYKVNSLIKKGYLTKERSETDHREYHLKVTQKYLDYYNVSKRYIEQVLAKTKEKMTQEQWDSFHDALAIVRKVQEGDIPAYGRYKNGAAASGEEGD
ncbi:MAG: MarR family transcriptional regulator [Lachnospiraceae bacterium]|nr:MarR family transcriptional regulator [Lachnospiraceae bacterium]